MLWREKVSVWIANDPLPFCRAALVRVFNAPFISRGLYEEMDVKRDDIPARDIFVRSGSCGTPTAGKGLALTDILLVAEIDCVALIL